MATKEIKQENVTSYREQQPLINILKEYEEVNKGLTALVDSYDKDQQTLRNDCTQLIAENDRLSTELKDALEKLQSDVSNQEVTYLKQQLTLALLEKEEALRSCNIAVGEVSNLEKVLKIFQERKSEPNYGINARLDKARALTVAESELVEAKALIAKERIIKAEIESKLTYEIESHKNTQHQLEAISRQLQITEEERTLQLKSQQMENKQIKDLLCQREDLEKSITLYKQKLNQAMMNVEEGRKKVSEALSVVDNAVTTRDQALSAQAKSQEEVIRLQGALKELTEEASSKVKKEVEQIKQQCNARIHTLIVDMRKIQEECSEQRSLAERGMKSQIQAEEILDRKNQELKVLQMKVSAIESKLSTTNAQLIESERHYQISERNLESIKRELFEQVEEYKKHKEISENKIKQMDLDMKALVADMDELRRRAQEVAQDMSLREKQICTKYQVLEKSSIATINELQEIINAHKSVNEKCQTEMKFMAERFNARLKELRNELDRVRHERDDAHRQLHVLKTTTPQRSNLKPNNFSAERKLRPKSLYSDC